MQPDQRPAPPQAVPDADWWLGHQGEHRDPLVDLDDACRGATRRTLLGLLVGFGIAIVAAIVVALFAQAGVAS